VTSFKEFAVLSVISGVGHIAPFDTVDQAESFMEQLGEEMSQDGSGNVRGEWHLYRMA
jgi:hypothetical protein